MENSNTFVKLISVSWLKENKMSFLKEFREFAMRGNVVDLAVGVIIGAAFGKIVSSLVADIIMPPLGLLIGGIDFKQFAVTLRDAQGDIPAGRRASQSLRPAEIARRLLCLGGHRGDLGNEV